jgi:hypothetical protein
LWFVSLSASHWTVPRMAALQNEGEGLGET